MGDVSNNLSLAEVLQRPDIWRGDALAQMAEAGVGTGFPALDAELPGGGWPRGQLTELLPSAPGGGELALLQPALAELSAGGGWLALVAPPWRPHAPAWADSGIRLSKLAVIEAGNEALWCCEQLLASGAFAAVLAWLDSRVQPPSLRRLQAAVEGKRSLAFLWRSTATAALPSPAPLRLRLQTVEEGLAVGILKRRGGPAIENLLIPTRRGAHVVVGAPVSSSAARSAGLRVVA